jgi:PAS domain S-box-containing protein
MLAMGKDSVKKQSAAKSNSGNDMLIKKINISIRLRIYLSFLLFGLLFIINAMIALGTIYKIKNLALHITTIADPAIKDLDAFHDIIIQSKLYSLKQVFSQDSQDDKDSLLKIQKEQYPYIRTRLTQLSAPWPAKKELDSLQHAFAGFEQLIASQKKIQDLLQSARDYNDPVKKTKTLKILHDEIIPQTEVLLRTLSSIAAEERGLKSAEVNMLDRSLKRFWTIILILIACTICTGLILSKYLVGVIVNPVGQIRSIVGDLAKGVTSKIIYRNKRDEIGQMIAEVNHLSDRLQCTASFARKVGERNYHVPFQPLGNEDTLGRALVAMRDNLKFIDESLNEAQHTARIGNWRWDLRINKVFWSDELYRIFEKDLVSFTPSLESFALCVHPDDREFAVGYVRRSLIDHQPFVYQCRIVNGNGQVKKIVVQGKVSVEDGELAKMSGIVQDITLKAQKEEELRQTNERFHHLSKATNDSIWDWDLVTDEVWWNDNFYEVFGYDPAHRVPTVGEWIMKMHPGDRTKIVAKLKEIRQSRMDSWQDEFRYFKKDGTVGIALNRAYILRDHDGRPLRVIGAVQDITERINSIKQIAESERRYRQIVETAQEGIWLIDENNYTVFVNKKMCKMLEYSQDEMIGKQNYEFKDEKERESAAKQIEQRKKDSCETHETTYITKSGKKIWAYVSTNPVFDENGNYKGALAMVTDITQRKLQEELLKKSEASLELKNRELERKNTELEQFAYIASHDLQEPLRTVSSFAEHFQKQYRDRLDDMGHKYLYFIQQGTERMKTLITDLLEYSRIGRGKEVRPVDCNEIIHTVISDLDTAIQESKVEIKAEKLPVVSGYSTEMKQLFQNLVVNAIKFRRKEVPPVIRISSHPVEGGWEFIVQDNGIGIEEQYKDRIFVIFQRLHTRNEYEGSGIGLSHCRKIVELHGGKIWMKSKPGEGSTFHFTILENHN